MDRYFDARVKRVLRSAHRETAGPGHRELRSDMKAGQNRDNRWRAYAVVQRRHGRATLTSAIRSGQFTDHRGRLLLTIAVVLPRTRLGRTQAPVGAAGSAADSGLVVAARPAVPCLQRAEQVRCARIARSASRSPVRARPT